MYVLIITAQVCPDCLILTLCSTACYNFDSAILKCLWFSPFTNSLKASKHSHTHICSLIHMQIHTQSCLFKGWCVINRDWKKRNVLVTGEFSTSGERKEGWGHSKRMSPILEAMEVNSAVNSHPPINKTQCPTDTGGHRSCLI